MNNSLRQFFKSTFIYNIAQVLRQFFNAKLEIRRKRAEIRSWELSGHPVPPPNSFKQRIVREYGAKFSTQIFVETGTCRGSMIEATKRSFKKIYSIELDNALFESAVKRFEQYSHISLHIGDSGEVLPRILDQIDKPALFWLDAHYSGGITAKGKLETPIVQEINSILGHKIPNHVILIDDARLFIGEQDYPTIAQMKELVSEKRPDFVFEIRDDIMRIHAQADMP